MASRRDILSARRKPRASRKRNQGIVRSPVRSAAVRSNIPQCLKASRKRHHDQSEEVSEFERAVRTDREPRLSQRKRHVHNHSSVLSEAKFACRVLESPLSSTIKVSKETSRSSRLSGKPNHRATSRKRLQSFHARHSFGQTVGQGAASDISPSRRTHISYWVEQKTWPRAYFEHDNMHHLIARQKSTASLRRKRSDASLAPSATPSDQRSREEKSAPYRNPNYPTLLEAMGNSYMDESELGITDASKVLCQSLLNTKFITPQDTLFRHNAFPKACKNLRDKRQGKNYPRHRSTTRSLPRNPDDTSRRRSACLKRKR